MVSETILRIVAPCWRKPSVKGDHSTRGDVNGRCDGLLWYKDSGNHVAGEFSMSVIQANNLLEDHSKLESGPVSMFDSGPQATFVGVYDGHGGPEAARYGRGVSISCAAAMADKASDCFCWSLLSGIICSGSLYIANAGDSRVVLGRLEKAYKIVKAVQLSSEHNASYESVREELRLLHPDDPQIVVLKHKVWRVKGIIQVSRSIGDAYLKKAEFNREPLLAKFRVPETFHTPILLAEPAITVHKIHSEDKFLIFASDGLWEHMTNQEAVDIVNTGPRNGIARKLIKTALREAAKKREMRYSDLKKIDRGVRRHFHDDITVIVVFLDSHLVSRSILRRPLISISGGGELAGPSSTP
ncbi:LOW QUALITY PROTEIN: hypothetical protein HID58_003469 [Brassica napus]|uniref:protein-serine/threonine phosphatase n=1 Tax=Brassica napus TaxID=3708 RepID=A0ABQ8EQ68_BRANA|nr:LOW QUALITY PROTEIN: hypothetical protein HID58_003469 [Brassica napus]